MEIFEKRIQFYHEHYDIIEQWFLSPDKKVILGDRSNPVCRFCGKKQPEVTFNKKAHAIPEMLGNKSIISFYECDTCNGFFGSGIETDLGNWSKPSRTFSFIRGKNNIPSIKQFYGNDQRKGWVIKFEKQNKTLEIECWDDDRIFELDEEKKRINLKIKREPYTPVAVLKAFLKIGVTLLPENEISYFQDVITFIREKEHSKSILKNYPIIHTFTPNDPGNKLIVAMVLRRKIHVKNFPYIFIILSYGNETYQFPILCSNDNKIVHKEFCMPTFPVPTNKNEELYDKQIQRMLQLTGTEIVKDEVMNIVIGYKNLKKNFHE